MANERQWLRAEQKGEDKLAEEMFAQVIAGLSEVQPSTAFINRTVQLAWRARVRRRRMARAAYAVAAILVAMIGAGSIYELIPFVPSLIANGALVVSRTLIWLLAAPAQGAGWWWFAERIGSAVAEAIARPSAAAMVGAVEMIGILGIYAFRQVLRDN